MSYDDMVYTLRLFFRSLLPARVLGLYYWGIAQCAAWWYAHPSRDMIIIGVTGTNGKSTTVNMIGRIAEGAGYRVGWTSTANYKVDQLVWLNDTKMTMAGRFYTQRLLHQMKKNHCEIAVVETSSQGLAQSRHVGIEYDIAVFTNLSPEHLESHGGYDQYRRAKGILFGALAGTRRKKFGNVMLPKTIVANLDDDAAGYVLLFSAEQRIGYTLQDPSPTRVPVDRTVSATIVKGGEKESRLDVDGCIVTVRLPGRFNAYNAVAAIAATSALDIPISTAAGVLQQMTVMPGRVEWVDEGQPFRAMVDYAPEPESLRQLYEFLSTVPSHRIIHVLGSAGGGRDRARRPVMGSIAARNADVVIITNEDPYDEDPQQIMNEVAAGASAATDGRMKELRTIMDRRDAIGTAVRTARAGDLLLVTGKACEQAICVAGGKKIPWDDRVVLREEIRKNSGA